MHELKRTFNPNSSVLSNHFKCKLAVRNSSSFCFKLPLGRHLTLTIILLLTPFQMKMKKTGDWRREILGDMTLMNAEEVTLVADWILFQCYQGNAWDSPSRLEILKADFYCELTFS